MKSRRIPSRVFRPSLTAALAVILTISGLAVVAVSVFSNGSQSLPPNLAQIYLPLQGQPRESFVTTQGDRATAVSLPPATSGLSLGVSQSLDQGKSWTSMSNISLSGLGVLSIEGCYACLLPGVAVAESGATLLVSAQVVTYRGANASNSAWGGGWDWHFSNGTNLTTLLWESHDNGLTWSTPLTLSQTAVTHVSFASWAPPVLVVNDNAALIVYQTPVFPNGTEGTFIRTSNDLGTTWTAPLNDTPAGMVQFDRVTAISTRQGFLVAQSLVPFNESAVRTPTELQWLNSSAGWLPGTGPTMSLPSVGLLYGNSSEGSFLQDSEGLLDLSLPGFPTIPVPGQQHPVGPDQGTSDGPGLAALTTYGASSLEFAVWNESSSTFSCWTINATELDSTRSCSIAPSFSTGSYGYLDISSMAGGNGWWVATGSGCEEDTEPGAPLCGGQAVAAYISESGMAASGTTSALEDFEIGEIAGTGIAVAGASGLAILRFRSRLP